MSSTTSFYPSWFAHNIVFVAASLLFSYVLFRAFYNLFLSPLSAIPGPWYAAVSDFWITTHVLRLRQCKVIQELFDTYGPVVRIGPKKVVFRDLSTMRNVYTVHKFDKSTYYKGLKTFVSFCLLSGVRNPNLTTLTATTTITRKYHCAYTQRLCPSFGRMTTLDHATHSMRRKGFAPHYTPTNIALFEPEMHEVTLELVNVCFLPLHAFMSDESIMVLPF